MNIALPNASSTLAEADDWWLVALCPCGRTGRLPCRLLARELRPTRTLAEVARRLVCRGCGLRPAEVELVDDIQLGALGYVASGQPRPSRARYGAPMCGLFPW